VYLERVRIDVSEPKFTSFLAQCGRDRNRPSLVLIVDNLIYSRDIRDQKLKLRAQMILDGLQSDNKTLLLVYQSSPNSFRQTRKGSLSIKFVSVC